METVVCELLKRIELKIRELEPIRIEEAILGLGYSGVRLNTGQAGICYTPKEVMTGCCSITDRAGTIAGSPALRIAALAKSWGLGEAAVGIATINSISDLIMEREPPHGLSLDVNVIDCIDFKDEDTVAMVGCMSPFVPIIEKKTRKLHVLERDVGLRLSGGCLPDTAAGHIVPEADVVIITGASIINHTIDQLLNLSKNAREIAIVGPTASMLPDPFFERGVTVMGGIKVIDSNKVLQIIAEGGGVPQLKRYCTFYVIRNPSK